MARCRRHWRRCPGTVAEAPSAASAAQRLRDEGVEPHAWSNGPHDRYGVHAHDYTKLLVCAAGSITFLVGPDAAPVELSPGDGFVLPPGTPARRGRRAGRLHLPGGIPLAGRR